MRWLHLAALLGASLVSAKAHDGNHERFGMERLDGNGMDVTYDRAHHAPADKVRPGSRPRIGVVDRTRQYEKIATNKHKAAAKAESKKAAVNWGARLQKAAENMVKDANKKEEQAETKHHAAEHAKANPHQQHHQAANAKHAPEAHHAAKKPTKANGQAQHMNKLQFHGAAASPQEGSPNKVQHFALRPAGDPSSCVATITTTVTAQQSTTTVTVTPTRTTTTTTTTSPPSSYTTSALPAACTGTNAICPCASGYQGMYIGNCEWECLASGATPPPKM